MLEILFRYGVAERMGTIILSALVVHTGWHWMTERADRLRQFQIQWPPLTAALLASVLRWLMLVLALGALLWFISGLLRKRNQRRAEGETASTQ
jgi:hypothetical protein